LKYLVVFEKSDTGFSAYSPDVDGCIAAGHTRIEVEELMKEALAFHLEGLREDEDAPSPRSYSKYIDVPA